MNGTAIGTRRYAGLAVLLAICGGVLALELSARLMTPRLSGNLAHVAGIPRIIADAAGASDPAALLVGNSLTNNGMDVATLNGALPDLHVAKVTPDATDLWDWQCILRHQLLASEAASVDAVVFGTAWHLLSDQADVDASRQGGLFCRFSDLARPARIGLSGSGAIGEFMLARTLRLYALRSTVRNRFFAASVPHYREFVAEDNAARAGRPEAAQDESRFTYRTFAQLASDLRARGSLVIVVAMPVPQPYELDAGLLALAQAGAITLLDYRRADGISASSYIDSIHLGPTGSVVLSKHLAGDLARLIPQP